MKLILFAALAASMWVGTAEGAIIRSDPSPREFQAHFTLDLEGIRHSSFSIISQTALGGTAGTPLVSYTATIGRNNRVLSLATHVVDFKGGYEVLGCCGDATQSVFISNDQTIDYHVSVYSPEEQDFDQVDGLATLALPPFLEQPATIHEVRYWPGFPNYSRTDYWELIVDGPWHTTPITLFDGVLNGHAAKLTLDRYGWGPGLVRLESRARRRGMERGPLATAIPEPSTLAILVIVAACIAGRARKR